MAAAVQRDLARVMPYYVNFDAGGHTMQFEHPLANDHIAKCHAVGAFYERPLLRKIRSYERPGVYIDVGAHVGNHSVYFSHFCRATEVWAFEPDVENFRCLLSNLSLNDVPNVVPFRLAVGERPGFVQRLPPTAPNNSGMVRFQRHEDGNRPLVTLDAMTNGQQVAVVKIDVEGFDVRVLRGAQKLLHDQKPIVSIEAHDKQLFAAQASLLKDAGYELAGQFNATPTYLWVPK